MRHQIPTKVPRLATLALVCGGLSLAGCKKKEEPKQDEAKAEAADGGDAKGEDAKGEADPTAVAPTNAAPGATLPVLDRPLAHDKGVVLGHVLLTNPAQTLKDFKEYAPPEAAGFMDANALKAFVGMQAGERAKVVQGLDLEKPHGCAVVDIKAYEDAPVACAIAYTGGAKKFVEDMGDGGKQDDAEGHLAVYEVEGNKLYIDELGDYVGVTGLPDVFGKTKTYLEQNIVARGAAPRADVEVVAFVSDLFETYPDEMQPFLDQMRKQDDLSATADPRLKQLQSVYQDYNAKNSERTIRQFKDMKQVSLDIGVDQNGLMFGATMVASPDGEAAKLASQYGGGHVDPALATTAPDGSWLLMLGHNERGAWRSDQAQDAIGMLTEGWATLSGGDATAGKAALDAFLTQAEELYGNDSMLALADVDDGLFGAVMVTPTKKPAREAWLTWSKAFEPKAVLGDEGAKYVTWKFEPEHAKVGDVVVDRWTIEPTPDAKKGIEKDLSDKDKQQMKALIGDLRLVIDRTEVEGRVAWTIAPKAEDAWTQRVVEAQQGKNSLANDPGLKSALAYHAGAGMVFGVDINGMFDWVKGIPEVGSTLDSLPNDLGDNLSDLLLVMEYRKDGVTTFDFVISPAVIKEGVTALTKLGKSGLGGL